MALRDWLEPGYDPLATENPAICSKSEPKIARIATIAAGIAKPAIQQVTDFEDEKIRNSKNSRNSNSNVSELKKQGMQRLEKAAQGLPVELEELAEFFSSDLQSFGTGEVLMDGIIKAVRWYAFSHMQRSVYWYERDKADNVVMLDNSRRRSIR